MTPLPLKAPSATLLDDARLRRLDWLAYFLDNAIRVPGTQYRVGYDAVIGLVPGLGDIIGAALSVYLVLAATRYRLPTSTLLRMMLNVGLEALIGMIPLLGDLFDATYKANARNLALLHAHLEARGLGASGPSDRGFFWSVVLVMGGVFALIAMMIAGLIWTLRGLLGSGA